MISYDCEHEAFAASRVTDYVYVPTRETLFSTLDQHADTLEGDIKPPLVLIGNEGSGKSALLANWVSKRLDHKHRDEFLFQHFVGCTTPSLQLAHTLFRLETALKDFYQLREMKVPDTEEDLRWSLNRFLAAAAKKHNPARIVIIIDGIHRLKSEGTHDGALHWLPIELPPCVRFIISTVEFERAPLKGKIDIPQHKTYVELARRQCPTLRVEPLIVTTRHNIISEFSKQNKDTIVFTENEQFKIVTAPATSQPMYLRSILEALRLTCVVTDVPKEQLLESFLSCSSAHDLVDRALNICFMSIFGQPGDITSKALDTHSVSTGNHSHSNSHTHNQSITNASVSGGENDILGKMLTVIYASRNGLTMTEVLGLMKMVANFQPNEIVEKKLFTILKSLTMVVNDMYSFSHEVYREVVYEKYIRSREGLIRWHYFMARYFGQLQPCHRKLNALPYHLEEAGSWSKVKNCLTDVEMFELWWSPKFKADFIKFWSLLTRRAPPEPSDLHASNTKGKSDRKRDAHAERLSQKPSFDIVDEYVKSLEEYRTLKHPTDEQVSTIILKIADFLLEFATLGHEAEADVPANIHPTIPSEDLKAVGVPYIDTDHLGRSTLYYPSILKQESVASGGEEGVSSDAPAKALEDVPICTNYFFQRWMWIQFPFIALGNCNDRYQYGIQKMQELRDQFNKGTQDELSLTKKDPERTIRRITGAGGLQSTSAFKLPEIKFNRKAARSIRRVNHEIVDDQAAAADKFTQRMTALHDDIQNYREEHDFVMQMQTGLKKRLAELKGSFIEITRSAESVTQFDGDLESAINREKDSIAKYQSSLAIKKNLDNLALMCDRHPAKVPALITELELKVEQDKFLIAEIKKRLWEQRFEKNTHVTNFRKMRELVKDGVKMHNSLLEYRYFMRSKLTEQQRNDEQKLMLKSSEEPMEAKSFRRSKTKTLTNSISKDLNQDENNQVAIKVTKSWDESWEIISGRTGIIEPDIFFKRLNNRATLEEQISVLKKASESKLQALKLEVMEVEAELSLERDNLSGGGGESTKDKEKEVIEKRSSIKHIKERSESCQSLVQQVERGLHHIAEALGIEAEADIPALDLLREIEAVLDTVLQEREKQVQSQSQTDSTSRMMTSTRDAAPIPETHHRSPELELALSKYEVPKTRLPQKLPSKPMEVIFTARDSEPDDIDPDDEGMWDRNFAKSQSLKNLKREEKKAAKKDPLAM